MLMISYFLALNQLITGPTWVVKYAKMAQWSSLPDGKPRSVYCLKQIVVTGDFHQLCDLPLKAYSNIAFYSPNVFLMTVILVQIHVFLFVCFQCAFQIETFLKINTIFIPLSANPGQKQSATETSLAGFPAASLSIKSVFWNTGGSPHSSRICFILLPVILSSCWCSWTPNSQFWQLQISLISEIPDSSPQMGM